MLQEYEIKVGLVLHMEPDVLIAAGATCTAPEDRRVQKRHAFLCTGVEGHTSRWRPLYSRIGPKRIALPVHGRHGQPFFVNGVFHWHPDQEWTATFDAVARATIAAGEQTTEGARNYIDAEYCPVTSPQKAA